MWRFDGRRLNVLLIEDNVHFRLLLRTVLTSMGMDAIREAYDGEHALSLLREAPADLLILDWKMAPMDGLSFVRKLRRCPGAMKPEVPVLMVTGHADDYLRCQARDAGIDGVMAKPVSAKELITQIGAVLSSGAAFIRGETYVGPDRRCNAIPGYTGPERRRGRISP
jgi:DNA-binding response OmpR family regulator